MTRVTTRAILLLLTIFTASATAQTPAPAALAPPFVREGATIKLSDHVWAIPDFNVGLVPNVGIIVGSRARGARRAAWGVGAFTGAKIVMTRVQQQEMTEVGKQIQETFAKRSHASRLTPRAAYAEAR